MPEVFHKDDEVWIFTKLSPINQDERWKVCSAYTNVFNKTFDAEPLSHRKTGRARFAANNRLRIYVDKKFAVFNK